MTDYDTQWWRPPLQVPTQYEVMTGESTQGAKLPFYALLIFTIILLLAPQEWFPQLAPLRIAFVTAAIAVCSYIYSRLARHKPIINFSPPLVLAFVLASWAVLTIPTSMWPSGSVEFLLDKYFKTLVVFFLLAHVIDELSKLQTITWALVLMAIPLALTTLSNYLTGVSYEGDNRIVGYSSALTANPNDMALMLNLILPLCIGLFLAAKKTLARLFLIGTIFLLVIAIVLTFSRGGFLTLGTIFITYSWLLRSRPERVWIPVVFFVGLVMFPLIPESYMERISTIVATDEDVSGSAQTRLGDLKVAIGLVMERPLTGAGVGMNALAMNEARGETWTEIHNVYLQYAIELGLPALLIFILIYSRCVGAVQYVMNKTRSQKHNRSLFCISEGLQVSLVAFAVAALFHPVAYHFYFYYMGGLALAAKNVYMRQVSINNDLILTSQIVEKIN